MKVIVSGATSFIGQSFISLALKENWEIVAVVRRHSSKKESLRRFKDIKIIELNISEYKKLGELAGCCDIFVHFAWEGTRGAARMDKELQKSNYEYSIDAIKSVIENGCKKIVLAGSQAEYGPHSTIITEETESVPNTEYGVCKLKLYNTARNLCEDKGVSLIETRFFSLYGPNDYEHTLIMSMINKMKKGEDCNLTECRQKWDFVYVEDAVRAVLMLCKCESAIGIYNIGSGDVRSLREYVDDIKVLLKSGSQLNYGAIPYPETGIVSIWPSIQKLKKETGWEPKYSFEKGIKEIIRNDK